jgi:hypothetical protein
VSENGKIAVTYDAIGRMNWHPDIHVPKGTPWSTVDEQYLIDNYPTMGAEKVSLKLGRTINNVISRVSRLRKQGRMTKPVKGIYTKRSHSVSVDAVIGSGGTGAAHSLTT